MFFQAKNLFYVDSVWLIEPSLRNGSWWVGIMTNQSSQYSDTPLDREFDNFFPCLQAWIDRQLDQYYFHTDFVELNGYQLGTKNFLTVRDSHKMYENKFLGWNWGIPKLNSPSTRSIIRHTWEPIRCFPFYTWYIIAGHSLLDFIWTLFSYSYRLFYDSSISGGNRNATSFITLWPNCPGAEFAITIAIRWAF